MSRVLTAVSLIVLALNSASSADDASFSLTLRYRPESSQYEAKWNKQTWAAKETAVIVCDMWDSHHCLNAVRRVNEMAPRMNRVLEKTRAQGAIIIHAPSSCTAAYKDHPARKNAQSIPRSKNLPADISKWCYKIPSEEKGVYPLDQSDGGEDDDPAEHKAWAESLKAKGLNPGAPWKSQIDVLKIHDGDFISDNGEEIWSILESKGIKNIMLVGVHTNMCVLGRPFGLRQMSKNGKNVVLVRDMTDTMYNPARWPYVSHFQGTDLIVGHIERFVCPTITSDQIIGGKVFRFKNDKRPKAVIVIAESLYKTSKTLPPFARKVLSEQLGFDVKVLTASSDNKHLIPGLRDALATADVVLLSVRRRALPVSDLEAVKAYLKKGKPLLALRTSSHAFDTRGKHPQGHADWAEFDAQVLGGNYHGHHPDGPITSVKASNDHLLLTGVKLPFSARGSLYKASPLAKGTTSVLTGAIDNAPAEPIAWTNQYGKAKVFYTSLGHESDFGNPQFVRLMENAVRWATGMKIAKK